MIDEFLFSFLFFHIIIGVIGKKDVSRGQYYWVRLFTLLILMLVINIYPLHISTSTCEYNGVGTFVFMKEEKPKRNCKCSKKKTIDQRNSLLSLSLSLLLLSFSLQVGASSSRTDSIVGMGHK